MRPPQNKNIEYERIKEYDAWIPGTIEIVQLEENRLTGFKDDETGEPKRSDMIRFKFALKGHNFPHYSRWMTYSFGEKSNLFLKYLKHLVEGAQPDMEFDLDELKGFPIKTMWIANGDFDNLESIRPLTTKLQRSASRQEAKEDLEQEVHDQEPDEDLPF